MDNDPISLRQEFTDKVLSHDYSVGPLLILAGPGAGKTFSMIETVNDQIKKGIDSSKFYVTTFTNAAAGDFESKIKYSTNVSTLHYRAKGIVHKYADRVELSKSFKILNEFEVKVILKDIRAGIVNFNKLYPDAEKIILPVCSRCPTAVLKAAHNLISKSDKQDKEVKLKLIALPETDKTADGGYVVSVGLKSAKAEAKFIGKDLETIIDSDGTITHDIMVLCANKKLGIELVNSIKKNHPNIPIQDRLSKKGEDTNQDLIVNYLNRFLSDNSDNLALRMILKLLTDISSEEILIILDEAQRNHTNLWKCCNQKLYYHNLRIKERI